MSECAAIVTRREDREMGKQGDRKARKQRAQEREQHRRQASANRQPPTANRHRPRRMPLYNGPTTPKPTGTRYGPLIHVTLNG